MTKDGIAVQKAISKKSIALKLKYDEKFLQNNWIHTVEYAFAGVDSPRPASYWTDI